MLTELEHVGAGVWIAMIALSLSLAFIIARSRAWTQAQVRRATSDLEGLNAFHKALLSDLSLEKVLALLTKAIAPGMGFQAANVYLCKPPVNQHLIGAQLEIKDPVYLEALFGGLVMQRSGLTLLPLADSSAAGGVTQCWMQPESRCNVFPKATLATRQSQCPTCEHFAVLGLLVVSHFGRTPSGAVHLREYADAAALAIKNARLYESAALERSLAQQKASELQLIYSVGRQVMQASDERAVLERLLDNLSGFVSPRAEGPVCMRVALRVAGDVRVVMTAGGGQCQWLGEDDVPASNTLLRVVKSALPDIAEGTVTVPMRIVTGDQTRAIGALEVAGARALEVSLLVTVAAQAAIALGNIAALRALHQRELEASQLADLGRAFAAPFSREPQASLRQLCAAVREYVGANCFITVFEVRQSLETRVISSSCSPVELRYPAGEDNLTTALSQSRQTHLTPDIAQSHETRVEAATFGQNAMLSVPLVSGERFVGAIHALQPEPFSAAQIKQLEGIAGQIALVLDNLELLHSLKSESERLEDVLEHLAEGVLVLEDSPADSLIPELMPSRGAGAGRANAAARTLLGIARHFTLPQLPAQVRASLERETSSLMIGAERFEVLTKRSNERTVVVLQDVSAFDAAQRSKAEFLGVVSHELRTPLTSIIGFVELMLAGVAGALSAEQADFLQTTQAASQTLYQTVQNLLIASNLEAGLFELRPTSTPLNFRQRFERFERLASEKKLNFHLELPDSQRVSIDLERIGLVLENLVSNAVRYTPSGGDVGVHIRVRGTLEAGSAVLEASVSDSGGGLRPDQEARLYQKFSRDARKTGEGAGIALYVAHAIVQASGGRLWSENRFGHGLTMHLAIPLEFAQRDRWPRELSIPERG